MGAPVTNAQLILQIRNLNAPLYVTVKAGRGGYDMEVRVAKAEVIRNLQTFAADRLARFEVITVANYYLLRAVR